MSFHTPKPIAQRTPLWRPCDQISRLHIPDQFRGWLLDSASLTHRLKQVCGATFRVRVIRQAWGRPRQDEARILKLRPAQRGLIREVQLLCNGKPCVFARTVIPVRTRSGRQRRLASLGSRPLGAFLFADPTMRRGPVEISRMVRGHDLFLLATAGLKQAHLEIWGRRSVFYLSGKPLLVSEIFLAPPAPCRRRWPYTVG